MAIPPTYGDLGKNARDLFSKGFNYGFYKFECKTKTNAGVEFTTNGNFNHESKINGSLETKYKWSVYGLTFREKWNTDNTLGTEITIEDQLTKGLKLSFDTNFTPQTGKKSGKIKSSYKREYMNANVDVDFDFAGPTIHSALVLGHYGWLTGCQISFDTSKSKLTKNNLTIGYDGGDFILNTNVNDMSEFGGSYFHRLSKEIETGAQISWTAGSNATRLGLAAKYTPEKETTFRAKVSNNGQIGLSCQQKLKDGMTLTLSTLIEGKNFSAGGHKVGLGLDLEA